MRLEPKLHSETKSDDCLAYHADASSEEPEAPSPADRYYKPNRAKPPKPVALNLIDRDDQEKRARAQLALDRKRELFLLERQLQQATVSKRRSTAKSVLDADVESGRRRSIDLPRNELGADLGSSRRRSVDLPRTESATDGRSGNGSRRGSGVSGVSPFYAAPVRMSNKKLVRNALSTVCLAGGALRLERERALLVSCRSTFGRARSGGLCMLVIPLADSFP
jgi:hypothetical protein